MRISRLGLGLCFGLAASIIFAQPPSPQDAQPEAVQPEAWQIVVLANQARAMAGTAPLKWDPALGEAARQHCVRMAAEGPISHRYGGEPDLTSRAGQAGAHFSVIEENVAIGPTPAAIHDEWMHSPGHRTNLMSPDVDRVGVAVVSSRGVLYAVADYARAVQVLTPVQVEAAIANLLRVSGITILNDPTAARAYCADNKGAKSGNQPGFRMLWQGTDLTH
jgi:hypothetical protein